MRSQHNKVIPQPSYSTNPSTLSTQANLNAYQPQPQAQIVQLQPQQNYQPPAQLQQTFNQNFQFLQGLDEQQLQNQINQQNQNQYKVAQVKHAQCQLPIMGSVICGIIYPISIIAGCYYMLNGGEMSEILFCVFIAAVCLCILAWCSEARKFLPNIKNNSEVAEYVNQMQQARPIIEYIVESYHTRQDLGMSLKNTNINSLTGISSGGGEDGCESNFITYVRTEQLLYSSFKTQSDNLNELFQNSKCLRLNCKFSYFMGNQLAERNWNLLKQAMEITGRRMDAQFSDKDSSTLPDFKESVLVYNGKIAWYLSEPVLYFMYFIGLSLLYDTMFTSITGTCDFNINKIIFCDRPNIEQIDSVLQENRQSYRHDGQNSYSQKQQQMARFGITPVMYQQQQLQHQVVNQQQVQNQGYQYQQNYVQQPMQQTNQNQRYLINQNSFNNNYPMQQNNHNPAQQNLYGR